MREMKYCSFFFFPKQQILSFKIMFLEERMDPRKQRHSKHLVFLAQHDGHKYFSDMAVCLFNTRLENIKKYAFNH